MADDFLHANETAWEFFGEVLHTNVLEEFYPRLVLHDQAQHIMMAGNSGHTIHSNAWSKVNPVQEITIRPNYFDSTGASVASAGLGFDEYESPDSESMAMLTFSGTIQEFGGEFGFTETHMHITEIVETLVAGSRQLGGGYAQVTEDNTLKILLDALDATDTNQRAKIIGSNAKAGTVADPVIYTVTAGDYMRVSDIFQVNVEYDSDVNGEALRYPDGNVHGIIHPKVKKDLFTQIDSNQPNLVDWLQTSRGQGMFEGGKLPVIDNVLIDKSARNTTNPLNSHLAFTNATWNAAWDPLSPSNNPWAVSATGQGFMSYFFVPGAFSNIDLANSTPTLIIQPFGSGGATGDALKRFMTVGIRGYNTAIAQLMSTRAIFMATATTTAP